MPSCGDRRDQRLHRHFGTFLVSHYDRTHYRIYIDCSLYSTGVASFFVSQANGPSTDKRREATTLVVVRLTVFLAHICVGSASVRPMLFAVGPIFYVLLSSSIQTSAVHLCRAAEVALRARVILALRREEIF
jgi:hypothetical protein